MESGGSLDRRFWILRGVFTMVMMWGFRCSSGSASAKKGMRWPWAMKGNNTICSDAEQLVVAMGGDGK